MISAERDRKLDEARQHRCAKRFVCDQLSGAKPQWFLQNGGIAKEGALGAPRAEELDLHDSFPVFASAILIPNNLDSTRTWREHQLKMKRILSIFNIILYKNCRRHPNYAEATFKQKTFLRISLSYPYSTKRMPWDPWYVRLWRALFGKKNEGE